MGLLFSAVIYGVQKWGLEPAAIWLKLKFPDNKYVWCGTKYKRLVNDCLLEVRRDIIVIIIVIIGKFIQY